MSTDCHTKEKVAKERNKCYATEDKFVNIAHVVVDLVVVGSGRTNKSVVRGCA